MNKIKIKSKSRRNRRVFGKKARYTIKKKKKKLYLDQNTKNWIWQILAVMALAIILVLYFGQMENMQGASMSPAIKKDDVYLINRMEYVIHSPKRGDIVVFQPQGNKKAAYKVKRVIGLPGESVQLKDGVIFINGSQIKESYEVSTIDDVGIAGEKIKLGKNEYFVLGDNRSGLDDSRQKSIGNIKKNQIYGKVWFIIKSSHHNWGFVK